MVLAPKDSPCSSPKEDLGFIYTCLLVEPFVSTYFCTIFVSLDVEGSH